MLRTHPEYAQNCDTANDSAGSGSEEAVRHKPLVAEASEAKEPSKPRDTSISYSHPLASSTPLNALTKTTSDDDAESATFKPLAKAKLAKIKSERMPTSKEKPSTIPRTSIVKKPKAHSNKLAASNNGVSAALVEPPTNKTSSESSASSQSYSSMVRCNYNKAVLDSSDATAMTPSAYRSVSPSGMIRYDYNKPFPNSSAAAAASSASFSSRQSNTAMLRIDDAKPAKGGSPTVFAKKSKVESAIAN